MTTPLIELRPFESLGSDNHGWLDANYHFSFSDYHDPARVQWGPIRVWNDDTFAPGGGFPMHPHQDMEIISYVRSGAISHSDSLGNEGRTQAGDVQVMSAGTGIRHAEFNREDEDTRLFQIWILPNQRGGKPHWGTRAFPKEDRAGHFVTLASGNVPAGANDDSSPLPIRTDAQVLGATIKAGESLTYDIANERRHLYLVPATGKIQIADTIAKARDGVAITKAEEITITALEDSEIVLVDAA